MCFVLKESTLKKIKMKKKSHAKQTDPLIHHAFTLRILLLKTHLVCTSFINEHSKLFGIYISNQMRWSTEVSGQEKPAGGGIRRRLGHGGGFHVISVKCSYLTAVTVLDKLVSARVFVVYYEITFQTRAFKLDQSYIVDWLKAAGLASITHRDSEGQCKEQCL